MHLKGVKGKATLFIHTSEARILWKRHMKLFFDTIYIGSEDKISWAELVLKTTLVINQNFSSQGKEPLNESI